MPNIFNYFKHNICEHIPKVVIVLVQMPRVIQFIRVKINCVVTLLSCRQF